MNNFRYSMRGFGEFLGGALGVVFGLFLFVLTMMLCSIINGYVFSIIWNWFVVTAVHLPALTVGSAIGVYFVVSFLLADVAKDQTIAELSKGYGWLGKLFYVLLVQVGMGASVLGVGWVIHFFNS